MNQSIQNVRQQFIEAAGHFSQSLGFGRILGQVYAYMYFHRPPQSLDDLTAALSISKGSASMVVRQLEQWGALRRVWIKGDRKDYYETTDDFGRIIRKAFIELVGEKMEAADSLLDRAEHMINGQQESGNRDAAYLKDRIAKLRAFRRKTQGLLESPVVQLLLKKR